MIKNDILKTISFLGVIELIGLTTYYELFMMEMSPFTSADIRPVSSNFHSFGHIVASFMWRVTFLLTSIVFYGFFSFCHYHPRIADTLLRQVENNSCCCFGHMADRKAGFDLLYLWVEPVE